MEILAVTVFAALFCSLAKDLAPTAPPAETPEQLMGRAVRNYLESIRPPNE